MQESLCKLGTNLNLNISHSNKLYIITVGSNCTISQLKILIGATIDISISDMKLIYKGNILKNNHQKIIETKLINNSKIIVMSSNGKWWQWWLCMNSWDILILELWTEINDICSKKNY